MRTLLAVFAALTTLLATGSYAVAQTGNGSEPGPHYNLNLIGTSEKSAEMDGNNGHRIFVNLDGATKINLAPGDDFQVVDANGTDRDGASFILPDPDLDGDGELDGSYTVYARPLGKPGGLASLSTCAEIFKEFETYRITKARDSITTEGAYCSLDFVGSDVLMRTKGKSTFTDVTDELLTLRVDVENLDTGEILELDVPLFDEAFEGYFWEYDNDGLRLTQLRFVYN